MSSAHALAHHVTITQERDRRGPRQHLLTVRMDRQRKHRSSRSRPSELSAASPVTLLRSGDASSFRRPAHYPEEELDVLRRPVSWPQGSTLRLMQIPPWRWRRPGCGDVVPLARRGCAQASAVTVQRQADVADVSGAAVVTEGLPAASGMRLSLITWI